MFYSETLLQKTGPLARVWLSANLERKLSKTHILQSSVKDSVDAIVNPGQAPMALRLSGQLLLGVVRIYSRKARYLLDDCNEALMKIKMAFRLSNNNDIPAGLHMPSRDALLLPDVLTEADNLEMPPLPDATFLLSQMDDDSHMGRRRRAGSRDINLNEDFMNSQFLQNSNLENNKFDDDVLVLDNDDLDLDLDLGLDIDDHRTLEFGRDAPAPGPLADAIGDSDLNIFAKDGMDEAGRRSISIAGLNDDAGFRVVDDEGDINMGGDVTFGVHEDPDVPLVPTAPINRTRISESPLSDIDPNYEQELADEHQRNFNSTLFDDTEEVERRPAQRARKLKVLQADSDTVIPSAVIKAQQSDHSKILRPQSFLPRDPMLYALMEMQRSGGFVSHIIRDDRSAGWAPELRGMLSLESIMSSNLKRKRDSGIADMDGFAHKSPRLDLDLGDEDVLGLEGGAAGHLGLDGSIIQADGTIIDMAADDEGFRIQQDDDEGFAASRPQSRNGQLPGSPENTFDITTAPLVHPEDSGPVSLGTVHAVHLLRDRFGSEAANSPSKRKNASVVFQELLPEATTSKADATKMFFEILVLATKDAVKVEQPEATVGAPIRVRGKRGLWGSWAEREAGGEIAEEEEVNATSAAPPAAIAVAAAA